MTWLNINCISILYWLYMQYEFYIKFQLIQLLEGLKRKDLVRLLIVSKGWLLLSFNMILHLYLISFIWSNSKMLMFNPSIWFMKFWWEMNTKHVTWIGANTGCPIFCLGICAGYYTTINLPYHILRSNCSM